MIKELEKRTGKTIIGNKSASGTQILDELAEEEIAINVNQISTLQDYLQNDNYIVSNIVINETNGVLEAINFKKIVQVLD